MGFPHVLQIGKTIFPYFGDVGGCEQVGAMALTRTIMSKGDLYLCALLFG